eukprot:gene7937-10770_t
MSGLQTCNDRDEVKGASDQEIKSVGSKIISLPKISIPPSPASFKSTKDSSSMLDISSRIPKKQPTLIVNPLVRQQQQQQQNSKINMMSTSNPMKMEDILEHKRAVLGLKESDSLPRGCFRLPLKKQYLDMLLNGSKTVEGRINTGIAARARENDYMLYFTGNDFCLTSVTEKSTFKTFREMLEHYTIKACLPDFRGDLDAAEKLYRSFPGYAEKEAKFGVIGIKLTTLTIPQLKEFEKKNLKSQANDRGFYTNTYHDKDLNGKIKRDRDSFEDNQGYTYDRNQGYDQNKRNNTREDNNNNYHNNNRPLINNRSNHHDGYNRDYNHSGSRY